VALHSEPVHPQGVHIFRVALFLLPGVLLDGLRVPGDGLRWPRAREGPRWRVVAGRLAEVVGRPAAVDVAAQALLLLDEVIVVVGVVPARRGAPRAPQGRLSYGGERRHYGWCYYVVHSLPGIPGQHFVRTCVFFEVIEPCVHRHELPLVPVRNVHDQLDPSRHH